MRPQGFGEPLGAILEIDRDHDNRRGGDAARRRPMRIDARRSGGKPSSKSLDQRIAARLERAFRQSDLIGIAQIEQQLRRRRIASVRIGLETAQNYLLEPRRQVRSETARRRGIAPQSHAQALLALGIAEWPHLGGEMIEQNAE